ncbi:MAG: AraC family transcriptional regulator [Cystobacter sp.]
MRKSLLSLVLAEVARAARVTPAGGFQSTWVGDVLRHIEQNCLGPLSAREVSEVVHKSPSYVTTALKRATGKSVVEWITAGRLSEARRRLMHTDELVEIIAERVGYADVTHFIRMFRRAHGVTPAAWRTHQRHTPSSG